MAACSSTVLITEPFQFVGRDFFFIFFGSAKVDTYPALLRGCAHLLFELPIIFGFLSCLFSFPLPFFSAKTTHSYWVGMANERLLFAWAHNSQTTENEDAAESLQEILLARPAL